MFLIIIGSIFLPLQTIQAAQKTNTNVFKYIFDRSSKPPCVINIQGKFHKNSTMENEYLLQDKRQMEFLQNSRINRLLLTAVLEEETEDNIAYLQTLIEEAMIDARDEHGQTPLMLASECGHIEFVKVLLKRGANVALRSNFGLTACDFAQNNGHEEIAKILEQHIRDLCDAHDIARRSRQTLRLAIVNGNWAWVEEPLEASSREQQLQFAIENRDRAEALLARANAINRRSSSYGPYSYHLEP